MKLLDRIADPVTAGAALKSCEEIDKLESDAYSVMLFAMSRLFREQPDLRELIKLKAIYEGGGKQLRQSNFSTFSKQ